MPTRLLLDGEDLRALMLRVRQEMGPDARIVKAERIRTGGIAGFFAKEHYELTVEVPDARPNRSPRRHPPAEVLTGSDAVVGLDALLAAADAAESGQELGAASRRATPKGSKASAGETGEPDAGEPSGPRVSTATDSFAEVLASMQEIVGPAGGPTDPAAEAFGSHNGPDGGAYAEPDRAEPDAVWPPAPEVLARAESGGPGSNVTALLGLGIPPRLLTDFADANAGAPLSQLVRRFEKPPMIRLEPGAVVAVVGAAQTALRTATQMAHRAGLDPREMVLAGDIDSVAGYGRRLKTPAAVARYRGKVAPDLLSIVVIGVSASPEGWTEGAELLGALEPDQAWAALDATRKAVDLRRWLRAVGARRAFDGIAASATFDAQAPGTVLGLGTPVAWVDGLPATAVVWAAVLSERLADDARWD